MITCLQLGRLGRAGNAMFQVASVIGIARRSGQPFGFPKLILHDMVERFGSTEDHELYKYLVNPLPELPEGLMYSQYPYIWDYRDINVPMGNWDMYGHYQSIKWFADSIDEVRYYFTFQNEYPNNNFSIIHYRGGDYIDDPDAYHPRCSREYYEKAIKQFPEGTEFLVFTDDWDAFMNLNLKTNNGKFHLLKGGGYINDFKKMKACKSFICANSSFSHFAALLGTHPDKKIIMPKKWFGAQANGLNFDSLYPPNAIVL